jgi:hypothetical protein
MAILRARTRLVSRACATWEVVLIEIIHLSRHLQSVVLEVVLVGPFDPIYTQPNDTLREPQFLMPRPLNHRQIGLEYFGQECQIS